MSRAALDSIACSRALGEARGAGPGSKAKAEFGLQALHTLALLNH